MADPNDRSRRRRRSSGARSQYGPYDHPTLTPRGYQLMQSSPLKDERYQMPLAQPPNQPFGQPSDQRSGPRQYPGQVPMDGMPVEYDVDGNPIIQIFPPSDGMESQPSLGEVNPDGYPDDGRADGESVYDSPGQYFADQRIAASLHQSLLQNTLPSRKFPNPMTLTRGPLNRYFQTKQVGLPGASPQGIKKDDAVNSPSDRQLSAIGRLVIHVDDTSWDQPAFGSAWIVGPSLIATCAHNLYDSNDRRWSRAIEFYPGFDYYQTGQPLQCNVTSCYIPSAYLQNPATNDDIGFCYVDRNIGDIVDAEIPIVPPETNRFFDDHKVTVMGYPAGAEFDFGKSLWASRGEYLFGRSGGAGDEFSPVVATNFGGGCSGCPWLAKDRNSGLWKAVGLSSGHARLHYQRGELNLMSLTSPMITQERLDRLTDDHVSHEFEQVT